MLDNNFFETLKELDKKIEKKAEVNLDSVELYANAFDELKIERPFFLENVVLAAADGDDVKLLKEKKQAKEPEDMVEKAHPESVYVSNALGDGGLVENLNEAQEKVKQMINKMPTGNIINIHAEVLNQLVKMANELEESNPEAVSLIDKAIAEIAGRSERLEKSALAFVPVAIGAGILALVSALGAGGFQAVKGVQENLKTDAGQLVSNIEGWRNDPDFASARPLTNELYGQALKVYSLADRLIYVSSALASRPNAQMQQQADSVSAQVGAAIIALDNAMANLQKHVPNSATIPGTDFLRTKGLIEDIKKDYQAMAGTIHEAAAQVNQAREKGLPGQNQAYEAEKQLDHGHGGEQQVETVADPERIAAVQKYLSSIGFGPLKITGKSDAETKSALVRFENYINKSDFSNGNSREGLGLANLPGNRLASLLDTSLTADKLEALVELFKNPAAAVTAQ